MNMEIDIINEVMESKNRDIVIRMDNQTHWSDHINALNKLRTEDSFYERLVSEVPKTSKGNKCYLSYNNKIYAWLEIYSITIKASTVSLKMFPYLNFVFPSLENGDFTEDYRYFYSNISKQ